MRILYIHQYFATRAGMTGTRSYEFAMSLVKSGHRVTMLTSNAARTELQCEARDRVVHDHIDGIEVITVRVPYSQRMTSPERMWRFVQFMMGSLWVAIRLARHDVIVASSTPLTVGITGMVAAITHRAPLVFEVRDLWPEAPIQMGVIRSRIAIGVLRWLERTIYRRSHRIIALSPGMRDGILAAGCKPGKVTIIPNCADLDLFEPGPANEVLMQRYGLHGYFVAGYVGALGAANGLEILVDAARLLKARGVTDVKFLVCGEGSRGDDLRSLVQSEGLWNLVLLGGIPRQELPEILRLCSASLVLFKNLPIMGTNSPNKLFDALASGRPIIVNNDGWTRDLVREEGVGRVAEPGSAESLAEEVLWLRDHASARMEMGRRARQLAESQFDRRQLAAQFERVLAGAAGVEVPPLDRVQQVEPPVAAVPRRPPVAESTPVAAGHAE
jgi:glycosyltransferase involved in cell wall biosynthesis